MTDQVTYQEGLALTRTHRCGECGSGFLMPWAGAGYALRCLKDPDHKTITPVKNTRKLYNGQTNQWEEFNVQSQELVKGPVPGLEMSPAQREPGLSVATLQHTQNQLSLLENYVKTVLRKDEDYGSAPGVNRDFLWKAGAENLFAAFNCSAQFEVVEHTIDPQTGYILYTHRCRAVHHGTAQIMEVGDGSCNSYEVKYRYRNSERVCPKCQAATIRKSRRDEGGWYCWAKIGGCGAQFDDGDQSVEGQTAERVENPDKMDLVNTIMKMSMKRASVDCAMRFPGVARFFAVPRDGQETATVEEGEEGTSGQVRQPTRRSAPRQGAQGAPGKAGANSQASRSVQRRAAAQQGQPAPTFCALHGNIRLGNHPEFGMVHKLEDGSFCNGQPVLDPTDEETAGHLDGLAAQAEDAEGLPPGQTQEIENLRDALASANITDEGAWCRSYLKVGSIAEWLHSGKTIGQAFVFVPGYRAPRQPA